MDICVFGASSSRLDGIYFTEAEKLGCLMAKEDFGLVFGGGREGLMGAVSKGAYSLGGKITGIAPRFFDEPGILFKDCTLILTDTMRERKALMEELSDAIIVLPGGIGTFEEFFEMLTLKQLGKCDKAIVLLNTAGYFDKMRELIMSAISGGFVSEACMELIHFADTPEDAIEYIKGYKPQTGNIKRLTDYNK